jgi:hypothetical protein
MTDYDVLLSRKAQQPAAGVCAAAAGRADGTKRPARCGPSGYMSLPLLRLRLAACWAVWKSENHQSNLGK